MRMALERRSGALESLGPRHLVAPVPLAGVLLGALVAAGIFFGDGSSDDRLVWLGGLAIVLATLAIVVASVGALELPALSPLGIAAVAFFAAFVLWQGITVLWSVQPDRTWSYFNRGLGYLALLLLGLAASRLRGAARVTAATLAGLVAVAIACALATKIFPGLTSLNERVARLSAPIGYWNALALLVDMAIPLALWIAAPRARPHWLRALGVLFLFAAGVSLLLTFSRGGIAVGLLALVLWFAIGSPRLESAAAVAIAVVPMLTVVGWAFTQPGLTKDGESHAVQVHDGRWFALALVLGGGAAFAGGFFASRFEADHPAPEALRQRLGRLAVVAAVIAVVIGIAALVAAGITPSRVFHKFSEPTATANVGSGTAHLSDVSSSSRWSWWKESWHSWEHHALGGTGAGTFAITHLRMRTDSTFATEPHNLPLQFLTETGIVGFVLFLGIGFAGAAALVETLRRLEGEERLAAGALVVALAAYVAHGLVDFDWDFVAVSAPALAVLGVLLGAGRPALVRMPVRRTLLATAAGAIAAAALYSLLAPWLATRQVNDAYAALDRGHTSAAISSAKDARDLNPASIEPLLVWAAAEHIRGDDAQAGQLYTKAIAIQPENPRPWYYRARFLWRLDGPKAALYDAQQAAKRDPLGQPATFATSLQQQLGAASTSP